MDNQNQNLNAQNVNNEATNDNAAVVVTAGGSVDAAASDAGAVSSEQKVVKRGRGRPRKTENMQVSPAPVTPRGNTQNGSDVKRGRGRPRGSGKLQILASIGGYVAETAGGSMTPHVLTVNPGEDVLGTIVTFFQRGPRAVCVLSCNGIVSSVTVRLPCHDSGNFTRYEGRFEIVSLTGSSIYVGGNGAAQRQVGNGMLNILLAKSDGDIFGGGLENSLIAATSIQLVLATFTQNISNQIKRRYSAMTPSAPNMQGHRDSEGDNPKVPKLTQEGEPSYSSPLTTGGVAANDVVAETVIEVSGNNATPAEGNGNVHSDPIGGIDLETVTEQGTSPDAAEAAKDGNGSNSGPQI